MNDLRTLAFALGLFASLTTGLQLPARAARISVAASVTAGGGDRGLSIDPDGLTTAGGDHGPSIDPNG
jgi:hypothetical protein